MGRTERHLERVTAEAGAPLASHANATIAAGGKRLRPLLVLLAAESAGGAPSTARGEERLVRAAVAVELVHSATLVHDDLIDGAPLRRGHPTVAAVAGREVAVATGDLLFSRAFAELARNGDSEQLRALSEASSALAAGELLQREDAYARGCRRRALPAPLRAEDRRPVRGGLPPGRARRGGALAASGDRPRRLRAAHRARLPDARRRARRLRPGGAHRQVARHRPARRHRHAAAASSPASATRSSRASTCASLRGPSRPRSCASGSPPRARSTRRASGRSPSSPRRRRRSRRSCRTGARRCWSSSPTRSSSATAEPRRSRCSQSPASARRRRGGALEVAGRDQVGVERAHEEVDFLGHVGVRHAPQVAEQRARAAVELVVEAFDDDWSKTPSRRDSHSGQRSTIAPVAGALLATSPAGRRARPSSGSRRAAARGALALARRRPCADARRSTSARCRGRPPRGGSDVWVVVGAHRWPCCTSSTRTAVAFSPAEPSWPAVRGGFSRLRSAPAGCPRLGSRHVRRWLVRYGSVADGERDPHDRPRGPPQPRRPPRRAAHAPDRQRGRAGDRLRRLPVAEPRAAAHHQRTAEERRRASRSPRARARWARRCSPSRRCSRWRATRRQRWRCSSRPAQRPLAAGPRAARAADRGAARPTSRGSRATRRATTR